METIIIGILVTICTLLLSAITYFVIKTYNRVDAHTDSISTIDTKLTTQLSNCKLTHEMVDQKIREIKEETDKDINGVRTWTKDFVEESIQLLTNKSNLIKS